MRTTRVFFILPSLLVIRKRPAEAGRFLNHDLNQCFLVVVFVVLVLVEVPVVEVMEPVSVLPMVVVPVVPEVVVAVVAVMAVPDVSVVVPDGITDVSVVPDIAVPDVSLVVIVDEVSLAAVSVTFVFSSFLQENANSATARTTMITRDFFIQFLLN
jgi:hypothetical protein